MSVRPIAEIEVKRELELEGALEKLAWMKISRRPAPASPAADITYGLRSSEEIVRGRSRRVLK